MGDVVTGCGARALRSMTRAAAGDRARSRLRAAAACSAWSVAATARARTTAHSALRRAWSARTCWWTVSRCWLGDDSREPSSARQALSRKRTHPATNRTWSVWGHRSPVGRWSRQCRTSAGVHPARQHSRRSDRRCCAVIRVSSGQRRWSSRAAASMSLRVLGVTVAIHGSRWWESSRACGGA